MEKEITYATDEVTYGKTKKQLKKMKKDCIIKNHFLDCSNCCCELTCFVRKRLGEIKM